MGLVDYSDSDSDSDSGAEPAKVGPAPAPAPAPVPSVRPKTRKQPAVAKIIDRSNPGRILVSLPVEAGPEEPPAKRARTAAGGSGGGGGTFTSLNSFLPAPKNPNAKSRPAGSSGGGSGGGGGASRATFRPGMRLKTSAEPAFSRAAAPDDGYEDEDYGADEPPSGPMPRAGTQPPLETANAGKVELVGKPLMFMPPSVARNIAKKRAPVVAAPPPAGSAASRAAAAAGAPAPAPPPSPQPKPAPLALFSTYTEPEPDPVTTRTGAYEPVSASTSTTPYPQPNDPYPPPLASESSYPPPSAEAVSAQSLEGIADELNLSASERRELLGRRPRGGGGGERTANVRLVNMGAEYEKNEAMRASGELQAQARPVRALQPGKHSVRQLVDMVHNQRDALEESFSQGKNNKREAGSRYGW